MNEPSSSTINVLLVDDDEDEYVLLSEILKRAERIEYLVEWADTYAAGLEQVEHRRHDAYLVDYRLGADSGVELIRTARARGVTSPMILLTGYGDYEIDMAAMAAGAVDYLSKKDAPPDLVERTIRYAVAQRAGPSARGTPVFRQGDLPLQTALARGASVREAAREAGISERTAHRRLREPEFRAAIEQLREQLRVRVVERLATNLASDGAGVHVDRRS